LRNHWQESSGCRQVQTQSFSWRLGQPNEQNVQKVFGVPKCSLSALWGSVSDDSLHFALTQVATSYADMIWHFTSLNYRIMSVGSPCRKCSSRIWQSKLLLQPDVTAWLLVHVRYRKSLHKSAIHVNEQSSSTILCPIVLLNNDYHTFAVRNRFFDFWIHYI
jgi:hypothetical protein